MLLQKDFGLQVGLDNFESLVKSLLELKPLIYDFGFICLKILGQTSDRIWFTILWARDVHSVWKCLKTSQKWVDGAYKFKFPISRFVPIFLWQTVLNFRFLWVNIFWNAKWDISKVFEPLWGTLFCKKKFLIFQVWHSSKLTGFIFDLS